MKRPLIKTVTVVLTACVLSGCSAVTTTTTDVTTESETIIETSESTEATTTTEARGHYEYKPVVMSSIFLDIMGQDMYDAYKNYIKAVQNGEDEFEVKTEDDYHWMIGQFRTNFQPVYEVYTESNYGGAFKDGKATFQYKISKEELAQKEAEFEEMVTGILNEALRDDYSDVEKILALYIYFSNNYTYDYDTYYRMSDEAVQGICAYRFFTTKHGICAECATAFSFLLLQAGVDATVCGGNDEVTGEGHSWTYVTINGKNYHVDPTYVMDSGNRLSYFMMTDEQRYKEGNFKKDSMCVACHYKSDKNGNEYTADDDFFAPLWDKYLTSFDHEKKLIYYVDMDGNQGVFDYSAFG